MKAEMVQRVAALRAMPGLAALNTDEVAPLAAAAEERFFTRGARLMERGAPVAAAHVILDGKLRIGDRLLDTRNVAGALEVLAGLPAAEDAVAESDVLALELRRADVLDFLEESFVATHGVMRSLAWETLKRLQSQQPWKEPSCSRPPLPAGPMTLADKLTQLHHCVLFGNTRLEALAALARVAVEERHPRGTVLWRRGERSGYSYIVFQGAIECVGPEHTLQATGAGGGVGVLESMSNVPRWFEARVAEDLIALRVEMAQALDIIEDHMDLAHDLLRGLAAGLIVLRRGS